VWDRAIASLFLGIEAARGYRKGHNPSPESAMSTTAQEGETSSRDRAWIGSVDPPTCAFDSAEAHNKNLGGITARPISRFTISEASGT
jgi:hypothetical protein